MPMMMPAPVLQKMSYYDVPAPAAARRRRWVWTRRAVDEPAGSEVTRWAWVKRTPRSWPQHARVTETAGSRRRRVETMANGSSVWWAWRTQARRSSVRDWTVRRGTLYFRGEKLFDADHYDLGSKYPEGRVITPSTARRLARRYPLRARTLAQAWAEFRRDVVARYNRWEPVARKFVQLARAGDPMSLRVVAAESRRLGRRLRLDDLPDMLFAGSTDQLFDGGDRDAAMLQARLSYIPARLRPRELRRV